MWDKWREQCRISTRPLVEWVTTFVLFSNIVRTVLYQAIYIAFRSQPSCIDVYSLQRFWSNFVINKPYLVYNGLSLSTSRSKRERHSVLPFSSIFQGASSKQQTVKRQHNFRATCRFKIANKPFRTAYISTSPLIEVDGLEAFHCENKCSGILAKWMAPVFIANLDRNTSAKAFKPKSHTLHSTKRLIVGT